MIQIVGPCAAETEEQLRLCAQTIPHGSILRAGIWKPRTSPDTFQGAGDEGLQWLARIRQEFGIAVATEVSTPEQVEKALQSGINHLWIGARTCANPIQVQTLADALAAAVQRGLPRPETIWVKNPVNDDATLWLGNIHRLQRTGIPVGAIHRGCNHHPCWHMAHTLRTQCPDIPLLLDPSHMTGDSELVPDCCLAAHALGYDGYMVEVHPHPSQALSDSRQQLPPDAWKSLSAQLQRLPHAEGDRELQWLRQEMDEVDDALWDTLLRRMDISRRIGNHKRQTGLEVLQPQRFSQILERRTEWAEKHNISPKSVQEIMEAIHRESVRVQK